MRGGNQFTPREARHPVLIRGRMRTDGPAEDVCVRNISRNGMMLQAREAPHRGSYVEVRLGHDVIIGRVIWASERRFGIATRDRVPLMRLLGGEADNDTGPCAPTPAAYATPRRAHAGARATGRSIEFLVLLLMIGGAAIVMAVMGYQMLAALTENVARHL